MASTVPESNAEVFAEYYPHVKYLVSRAGIRPDYVEDYAMMLMEKFIAKNVLDDYDPTHVSEVAGEARTASFRTFFSGFVTAYLRHYAERDRINARRSLLSTDMPVKITQDDTSDNTFLDLIFPVQPDTEALEVDDLIRTVRLRLAGNKKMLLFLDLLLLQVEEYGEIDVKELAEMFEVTTSTIHNWKSKLREVFDKCR